MSDWQNWQTRPSRRPRRIEESDSVEVGFPIAGVLVGVLSGLLIIGLIGLGVVNMIRKQAITPTPSVIAATEALAVATAATQAPKASPTIPPVVTLEPTPTPTPTQTPTPAAPDQLAPNTYARVINTSGLGVSMRAGPGTNNARLTIAAENSVVLILDGPRDDANQEGYIWWFIRNEAGEEGWAVEEYLEPTLPPEQ